MLVLDFAIPGEIIGVLRLFARLIRVCIHDGSENLVLREEEKIISRRRDVARRRTSATGVVRVLGNGLEYGTEFFWDDCDNRPGIAREARSANSGTHLRTLPSARIRLTAIYSEIASCPNARVIGTIA